MCTCSAAGASLWPTEADDSVLALKKRAQSAFAVPGGRLLTCSGGVLNGTATAEQAGLQTGDALTFLVKLHQVIASKRRKFCVGAAFAAIRDDGCVVTWGHADFGGDSRVVQDRLHNVRHIQSGFRAFAAILDDGSVVTWGDPRHGGDCSAVHHQLKNAPRSGSSTLVPFLPQTAWSMGLLARTAQHGSCCGVLHILGLNSCVFTVLLLIPPPYKQGFPIWICEPRSHYTPC